MAKCVQGPSFKAKSFCPLFPQPQPFEMWASNVLDSKSVFSARIKALGLAEPKVGDKTLADIFKENGWTTLGLFAFAVSFSPGSAASENDFVTGVLEKLIGKEDQQTAETKALKPAIRHLYFDAYTMVAADSARRLNSDPEPERPRNLPPQERAERLARLKEKVKPIKVLGETEPSDTLVDKFCTMQENGILRYVPWEDITRRDLEITELQALRKKSFGKKFGRGKRRTCKA